MFRYRLMPMILRSIGVNPGGGGRDPQILKWGVVGVVSGLLRSKREGREPRTPQFSNQIDATAPQVTMQCYITCSEVYLYYIAYLPLQNPS
jgi:hypothetical protein